MAKFLAANWKMNKLSRDLEPWVNALQSSLTSEAQLILSPPAPLLASAVTLSRPVGIKVAAQNVHQALRGAFTGEVSAECLRDLGVDYVIVGHSERREIFGESSGLVAEKAHACVSHDMTPIICVGETLEQRDTGRAQEVVAEQLSPLKSLMGSHEVLVAYEPVWAIGTGRAAEPEDANAMHRFIKEIVVGFGRTCPVLYGGSLKEENAASFFAQPDIDGGLVGGASLDGQAFARLLQLLAAS